MHNGGHGSNLNVAGLSYSTSVHESVKTCLIVMGTHGNTSLFDNITLSISNVFCFEATANIFHGVHQL